MFARGFLDFGDLRLAQARPVLIQLRRQSVAVRNGQVGPHLIPDWHDHDREPAILQKFLEADSGTSAGGENRQCLSAKRMNYRRRVDSATARVCLWWKEYKRDLRRRGDPQ